MNRATISIAGERREFFATADGHIFESVPNGSCPEVGVWPRFAKTCADAVRALLPEAHLCAQCVRAQQPGSHAAGYFVGRMPARRKDGTDGWAPYRGWLCDDHAELLWSDGYDLKIER